MYRTFVQQLEKTGVISPGTTDEVILTMEMGYYDVFQILKSPEYLREVPRVSPPRFDKTLSNFWLFVISS
jgi:hypothetical protein